MTTQITDLHKFTNACHYAAKCHAKQRRKGNDEPYIVHPLEVVNILTGVGVSNFQFLAAAVLHDVIEDTEATEPELMRIFGNYIKEIVREVTDDKRLPKGERKRLQAENIFFKGDAAKLIKLADKISNIRSLMKKEEWPPSWNEQDAYDYCIWSLMVGVSASLGRGEISSFESLWRELIKTVFEFNRSLLHSNKLSEYCLSLVLNKSDIPDEMRKEVNDYYKRCDAKEKK